jgi:hypothetical protein
MEYITILPIDKDENIRKILVGGGGVPLTGYRRGFINFDDVVATKDTAYPQ